MESFKVGDMVWIDGVDAKNNERIYYECKIRGIVDESFIVDPIEDCIYSPDGRTVVMFHQIDEIGLIT